MFTTASHTAGLSLENDCYSSSVVSRLKSFDLSKPIQATVIVDDCDDFDEPHSTGHGIDPNSVHTNVNNKTRAFPRKRIMSKKTSIPIYSSAHQTASSHNIQIRHNYANKSPTSLKNNEEHNPGLFVNTSMNSHYPHIHNTMAVHPLEIIINDIVNIFKTYYAEPLTMQHKKKCHFYILSVFRNRYENVLNYLIPLENNNPFLNNFIIRITTVAKNCSLPVTYYQIRNLLFEMMKWCKEKSMSPPPPYSALSTALKDNQCSISNDKDGARYNTNTSEPKACLFVSNLPAGEISISVNSDLYNLYNSNNNVNNPRLNENKNARNREPNHTSVTETGLSQKRTQYESCNPTGNTDLYNNKTLKLPDNDWNRTQNEKQLDIHQTEVTRSISRDSGFTSPLTFDLSDELIMGNKEPQAENNNEEIVINNDVPLNSNVRMGSCNVCKSATNTMCKGCFKIYYCSTKCSEVEWQLHKFFCQV